MVTLCSRTEILTQLWFSMLCRSLPLQCWLNCFLFQTVEEKWEQMGETKWSLQIWKWGRAQDWGMFCKAVELPLWEAIDGNYSMVKRSLFGNPPNLITAHLGQLFCSWQNLFLILLFCKSLKHAGINWLDCWKYHQISNFSDLWNNSISAGQRDISNYVRNKELLYIIYDYNSCKINT